MKTPVCSRCGFDIESAPWVHSSQHMLLVQRTLPVRADVPLGPRAPFGTPFWVCGRCHAPGEEIKRVVKERSAE